MSSWRILQVQPSKKTPTEVGSIKDPSKIVGAIHACEFGHTVTIRGEVSVHSQDQSTQTLQSITGVAQACNDTDLEIMSSNGDRVDDRAKASGRLAEICSNAICPKAFADPLRPYMSSTSTSSSRSQESSVSPARCRPISEEEPAQQVSGRKDVQTEARSGLDQEKRQKKHKSKHRIDLGGVFGPKQLLSSTPSLISNSGGPVYGQKAQKRK